MPTYKELVNVRCAQGRLVITESTISVRLGHGKLVNRTIARSLYSGLDARVHFMTFNRAYKLVFHGAGQDLVATYVKRGDYDKILDVL